MNYDSFLCNAKITYLFTKLMKKVCEINQKMLYYTIINELMCNIKTLDLRLSRLILNIKPNIFKNYVLKGCQCRVEK